MLEKWYLPVGINFECELECSCFVKSKEARAC